MRITSYLFFSKSIFSTALKQLPMSKLGDLDIQRLNIESNNMIPNKIIKNIDIPSCKNCIHFEPSRYNIDSLSSCNKFGEKNIITDEIKNDFADTCRKTEEKCGFVGKYFEKETDQNVRIKSLKNYWYQNSGFILVIGGFLLYIVNAIFIIYLKQ